MGKPSELVQASKLTDLPLWQSWVDRIASHIEAGGQPPELVEQLADDEEIAGSLFTAQLQGHLAGQLFVRAVEVPESLPQSRSLATEDSRPSFLRMEFQEALDAFLSRGIVSPAEFMALSNSLRLSAFTATRLASEQVVERAYEALRTHLAEGGTLRSFSQAVVEEEVSLGIAPSAPHTLELIYRTNVQQAYGQGRLQQLEHPAVIAARPFVQYRTAGDSRVRPAHRALDGVVFNRLEDPGWRQYAPPLGYSCRCSMVTLRPDRVDASQVVASESLGADVGAEPGWSGPGS